MLECKSFIRPPKLLLFATRLVRWKKVLENHLSTCAVKQMKGKNQDKAIKEILLVYKLSKQK